MNSSIPPAEGSSNPGVQTEFRRQLQAWREVLAQCGRKSGRKCVHNLRVATLRMQAELEYWLSRQESPDASSTRTARRWQRQGRKLRRALGPVRQADVSLGKLGQLHGWADPAAGGHPVFPAESLAAIEQIERIVKRERDAAAKNLVSEIRRRRKRLNRLSTKLEIALDGFVAAVESSCADGILAQVAAVSAKFPVLDSENLHDFRKQIKKIRYLAEIFAPVDPEISRHAATLKRITGAIGEWHDWQILTEEAARAEEGNSAMAVAAEFLQAQAGRSLDYALKLCRQSMARLLKDAKNDHTRRPDLIDDPALEVPRKPAVSASADLHPALADRSARAS